MSLPSGRLTFMFTDIEGSTRMVDRLGERYDELLARHHEIVRSAVRGNQGRLVRIEGDGAFAVFERAAGAVRAATDIQRAVAGERWAIEPPVRVRIGLHTGDARVHDHDYIGIDVHRAARVGAAAHGGQVLLTNATRDAAGSGEQLALRSLGEHRLKDLAEPVHLHQLLIDGVPTEFPPPRSLERRPNNLPSLTTTLLGRESELSAAAATLRIEERRLLTVTGPGGVGKTCFALELAARLLEDVAGGAFVVFLADVREPDVIAPSVARALMMREQPGRSTAEALIEELRGRDLLLVLDNLEQIPGAGQVVAELLAGAPGLRVLATSRAPLCVPGEQELPLPPLELVDSAELFIERARAVVPDIELGPDARNIVRDICRRLDGLPLAIELAAARVRVLPLATILERLDLRLPLLTSRGGKRPERQRTLRATLDWSHELLDADERLLFRRLAVFAGSCSLDAVEAVCEVFPSPVMDALDGLESLVEKSIVRVARDGSESRFWLPQIVREYAGERLEEAGEAGDVRRRQAEYLLEALSHEDLEVVTGHAPRLMARFEHEYENLRDAIEWTLGAGVSDLALRLSGAAWEYAHMQGRLAECQRWLRDALAADVGNDVPARMRALFGLSGLAAVHGDHDEARRRGRELLALAESRGDRQAEAQAELALAAAEVSRDPERARERLEECVRLARGIGDIPLLAGALNNLGDAAIILGELNRAEEHLRAGLALTSENDMPALECVVSSNLGNLALARGDLLRADELAVSSARLAQALNWTEQSMYALELLAAVAARRHYAGRAAELLGAAETLRERVGMLLGVFEQRTHDETLELLRAALEPGELSELWELGRGLSADAALALARPEAQQSAA